MYIGKFVFLVSLIALGLAEDSSSKEEKESVSVVSEDTVDDLVKEIEEKVKTNNGEIIQVDQAIQDEVERDIKKWINTLDCFNSKMSLIKCLMIKKASNKYSKNPKKDFMVTKERIKLLLASLEEDGYNDKHLKKLLAKHGYLLNGETTTTPEPSV